MNRKQVKENFRKKGIVIREWAKERGFNAITVYEVLNGVKKGNYGEPHRIAVALGLKSGTIDERARGEL